jgi:methylthioribose-1-phosphate isomerase
MSLISPIAWTPNHGVRILDQTLLPGEERYLEITTVPGMAEAITALRVRGAPLIGIAAAMGVVQGVGPEGSGLSPDLDGVEAVHAASAVLRATRPTAVNLSWALGRMVERAERHGTGPGLRAALIAEADAIWAEDRAMCDRIGEAGLELVPDGATVLTHCNAGALATGGKGTALAPIYLAHERGRRVQVIVDETRPLLQGSRLTAWELQRAGIPYTVIADGMAASRLRRGDVAAVLVGADRIAANGDVANKIGTYGLALAARAAGVPFYVAAPRSTIDLRTPTGEHIPIEQRPPGELAELGGRRLTPEGAAAWNPAFDVTPASLITALITDHGLLPPSGLTERLG